MDCTDTFQPFTEWHWHNWRELTAMNIRVTVRAVLATSVKTGLKWHSVQ